MTLFVVVVVVIPDPTIHDANCFAFTAMKVLAMSL